MSCNLCCQNWPWLVYIETCHRLRRHRCFEDSGAYQVKRDQRVAGRMEWTRRRTTDSNQAAL